MAADAGGPSRLFSVALDPALLHSALDKVRKMRAAKNLLWIQICLGVVGSFIAAANIHMGAMSAAWARGLQKEFEKMQLAPGFQMPAPIRDQSIPIILQDLEGYGHARTNVACWWMVACLVAVVLAALVLWCILQKSSQPLQATAAPPRA